jgi:hypothetical protein
MAVDADEPEAEGPDEPDDPDEPDREASVAALVEQLARDTSRLAACEATLGASRHVPQVRRAALGAAAAIVVVLAFAAAFALANWAAVAGLSHLVPTWLAALLLAIAWAVVGAVLLVVLLRRVGHAAGVEWWRTLGDDREEALRAIQASRDDAEQAVRETLDRLSAAIAGAAAAQLADAVMPFAGGVGEELLEASEDVVDAIEEQLPGGSAIGQVVDLVLFPGRVGLRVATTVLKGDSHDTQP